ncbi:LysR family transcriptional regulator [Enterococcus sp. HY326]|uniref:LysR family transcriptional regulator n=1 Tax=Enterococcus sp. HY326 TaxID=2971265 RepID=UPI002240E077|nr:LysR family transcriptional regulator [Enterococcus sp. HY326]
MDEKDIEMLLALQQTRNITQAAQLLFINQSSLSKRLSLLETKLGVRLFLRSKNGVSFTAEGEEVLTTAIQIQRLLNRLKDQLQFSENGVRGSLNLGCSINFSQYELPKLVAAFHQQNPLVKLNITADYSRTIYQKLVADEIDIAIIRGEFGGNFQRQLIAEDRIYLISQEELSFEELRKRPFISRKSDFYFQEEVNRWLIENDLLTLSSENILVDNANSCVEFVHQGLGWAIVPEITLVNYGGYKKEIAFKDGSSFIRRTYLMHKERALEIAPARLFKEVVEEKLK